VCWLCCDVCVQVVNVTAKATHEVIASFNKLLQ
jgi:hypothetical protein